MKIIIISSILTFEDLFNLRTFNQLPLSHWALILCGGELDTRFLVFTQILKLNRITFHARNKSVPLKQTFKHIKKRFLCCKLLAPRNQFAKRILSLVESFTGHYTTDQKSSLPSIFNSNLQLPQACMEMEGKLPIISNSKEKCYQWIFFYWPLSIQKFMLLFIFIFR